MSRVGDLSVMGSDTPLAFFRRIRGGKNRGSNTTAPSAGGSGRQPDNCRRAQLPRKFGLRLAWNASTPSRKSLRSLGRAVGVENAGTVVQRWCFCNEHGDLLSETDLEALWGNAGPCVGIERPKLQRALLPGVSNVHCRLGTSVISLAQDGHRVLVGFSDGSTGDYDLVVGADGIGSTERALALTTAAPSELGAINWRSIAPIRPAGLTGLQMHLGNGCTFGLVPMGAGRTYGFAYVVQPRFRDPLEGQN
jgi:FAD-dependent urate hydroxylase